MTYNLTILEGILVSKSPLAIDEARAMPTVSLHVKHKDYKGNEYIESVKVLGPFAEQVNTAQENSILTLEGKLYTSEKQKGLKYLECFTGSIHT